MNRMLVFIAVVVVIVAAAGGVLLLKEKASDDPDHGGHSGEKVNNDYSLLEPENIKVGLTVVYAGQAYYGDYKSTLVVTSVDDDNVYSCRTTEYTNEDDYCKSLPDRVKDSFYFVRLMLDSGFVDEGVAFCQTILEGLDKVAEESKNTLYYDSLVALREELQGCMESKNYAQWFDYRSAIGKTLMDRRVIESMPTAAVTVLPACGHLFMYSRYVHVSRM